MPYINIEGQTKVKNNVRSVGTPGELNYLITLSLIAAFRGHMKYETIHALKKDFVIEPKHNPFLRQMISQLAGDFTTSDVYAAAACAYDEFARRVVSTYEDKKIEVNGDLEEYKELIQIIDEIGKPVEEVAK